MNDGFRAKCLFCFSLFCAFALRAPSQTPPHWSYEGDAGPKAWGTLDSSYSACAMGHSQSPINITSSKKADLPKLEFDYKTTPLNIIDNGHSIQVNYAQGSLLKIGDKTYSLKQFHFHHPSEEHVHGREYDMVAHLVHQDSSGHLAVVAVFLTKGTAANAIIDTVWKNIPGEKEKAVDVPGESINVKDLLPDDHGYYTFSGSLTTPPCSEGVTWYVLKTPVEVSAAELGKFAKLYPKDARPIQPLYGREVLETK
ncbi:MAG TPA: carbonic anhydrase family protein [Candidatus Acidoferrum sp.]|nr:carbonic anhydrase family protein [Candidatus Acidoferrum sp.]